MAYYILYELGSLLLKCVKIHEMEYIDDATEVSCRRHQIYNLTFDDSSGAGVGL